jgi:UDP-N-acetyl-D-glucosamine dehydrogenase
MPTPVEMARMHPRSPAAESLERKLADHSAIVAVVGLGYVGLPLTRVFHDAGFRVLGYDRDPTKIEKLRAGENYLKHLGSDLAAKLRDSGRFTPTLDPDQLRDADAIILCVPSPLGRHGEPDMSYILESTRMVAQQLRQGQLVSLESTTYPGTTRDECQPILEGSGLRCGEDFFLAFSPEREDPGRRDHDTRSIPKLVGGVDPVSGRLAQQLYAAAVAKAILCDSAEIAEAAKILENVYRAVNIALVNELKPVLMSMGIDIWKVIAAAATKPFGFQAFYPGPGWGGHCIPIDPFYLTWKAREFGHHTRFIELAGEINHAMPRFVVQRVTQALNEFGVAVRGANVLIVGIAYKPDVDDVRETPAAEIIAQLRELGAEVAYHDPLVAEFPQMRRYASDFGLRSVPLSEANVRAADAVVVVTHHSSIDWDLVARVAKVVVDTRNVMAGRKVQGRLLPA